MFEIVGVKNTSFVGNDGKNVQGVNLHCINHEYQLDSGCAVERMFVPASRGYTAKDFPVGGMCEVVYNRFGKVQSATVVGGK